MDRHRHFALTLVFTALLLVSARSKLCHEQADLPPIESSCSSTSVNGKRLPRLICTDDPINKLHSRLLPAQAYTIGRRMDLQRATEEELEILPGIGSRRAKAIVKYRQNHREIGSIDDLLEIRSIGQGTLATLRPLVTVEDRCARRGDARRDGRRHTDAPGRSLHQQ